MTMWQREFIHGRRFKGQEGQSLVETALTLPLLLGIGFNIINWGYLWFMVLALSAAPRMGVQYATQGGAAGKATAPPTATVRDRKSTRLNSSHGYISYAVFCLKKKKNTL